MAYPTTLIAVGDLVTVANINAWPVALAEASGAAASYDFTSIPAIWTHLLILGAVQGDGGAGFHELRVRFNNNTESKYYDQRVRGSGSTASAADQAAAQLARIGSVSGSSAGDFSPFAIWIPNYAAVQRHSFVAESFAASALSANNMRVEDWGGVWDPAVAAAINQVTIFPATGSFVAGSLATVYGMGAL